MRLAHLVIVDIENVDRVFLVLSILVDPDDHLVPPVDHRLSGRRRLFDPQLGHARLNSLGHATHGLDLFDQRPGFLSQIMCQALDIIRPRQRIDHLGDARFLLQDKLRVPGDAGAEIRGKGNRLIKRIRVQRLRTAQNRTHRFVGGAHDVVVGILFLKTDTRCLAMGAQHLGFLFLCAEFCHDPMPEQARGAQLGRLHKEIHTDGEEEREARRKTVHIHSRRNRRAHILAPIGQRIGQFLHKVRTRLLHVIARDRDRVEFGHMLGGIANDVRHDPHRGRGRINISVADHELF